MKLRALIGLVGIAGLAMTPAAHAQVTVFTNSASWATAVGSHLTETFDGNAINNAGISVVATGTNTPHLSGNRWQDRLDGSQSTTWTFATAITAWGGDWDLNPGGFGSGISVFANIGGGPFQLVGQWEDINQFYGFKSATAFDSVQIMEGPGGGLETHYFDNMRYANVAAVPEPETYAMLLAGLGLLGFAARRRKLKESAAV